MVNPRVRTALIKSAAGIAGLLLFVLALQTLKAGARALGGLLVNTLGVDGPLSAFGFGWAFAYIVLSGSPVAAIALTFFAADVIDQVSTFTMIGGSRFGASFVVLLLGFIYVIRGRPPKQSLEMGVLALLTTYVIYGVAVPIGMFVLDSGVADRFHPDIPPLVFDIIDLYTAPIVGFFTTWLNPFLLFVVGIGIILAAFWMFDRALPDLSKESPVQDLQAHIYRPAVMFGLGCAVTLVTLSVSVSLGLLVPLSAKGIARRENVIPYIMGANVTTFVDTLMATLLLDKPEAFTIVLVEMMSVLAISILVLMFVYVRFERLLLAASRAILRTRVTLSLFVVTILLLPIVLILV